MLLRVPTPDVYNLLHQGRQQDPTMEPHLERPLHAPSSTMIPDTTVLRTGTSGSISKYFLWA